MNYLSAFTFPESIAAKLMNALGEEKTPFFFLISFDCSKNIIIPLQKLDNQHIKFDFSEKTIPKKSFNSEIKLEKKPISFDDYQEAFELVQRNIHLGNSFLTNLTCATPITINLDFLEIFQRSEAKYKLWLKDHFVCFSPETFVKISKNGRISSFPMKGTIDTNIENAENVILADKKELYEHSTIVDLIRNDLSSVSEKIWVEKFRYLDKIRKENGSELLQVSSEISGNLAPNWHKNLGDILYKMLPAGSISGAPKQRTIKIIKEAELKTYPPENERDFYTGIFGIFDGECLNSAVAIRFIEKTSAGLVFKSGGGITAYSQAQNEYQEMIQKIYVPII